VKAIEVAVAPDCMADWSDNLISHRTRKVEHKEQREHAGIYDVPPEQSSLHFDHVKSTSCLRLVRIVYTTFQVCCLLSSIIACTHTDLQDYSSTLVNSTSTTPRNQQILTPPLSSTLVDWTAPEVAEQSSKKKGKPAKKGPNPLKKQILAKSADKAREGVRQKVETWIQASDEHSAHFNAQLSAYRLQQQSSSK
jgi:hypothetical protein